MDGDSPSQSILDFVRRCSDFPSHLKADYAALYAHYFQVSDGSYDIRRLKDHLLDQIKRALGRDTGSSTMDLARIKRQLIYEHVVCGAEVLYAVQTLDLIMDSIRTEPAVLPLTPDAAGWQEAVQAAHHYLELDPDIFSNTQGHETRAWNVGKAAKALLDRGIPVDLINGDVHLSDDAVKAAVVKIRILIRKVGPLQVVANLFAFLSRWFDPVQQRYHFGRRPSAMPQDRPPTPPFGYLLNQCVREMDAVPLPMHPSSRIKAIQELEALATALAAVLDVEIYNVWEVLMSAGPNMLSFLQKLVIFDWAYSFPQMRPTDVVGFLTGVFDWVDDADFKASSGWTMANARIVIGNIIKVARDTRGPVVIHAHEFDPDNRVPAVELDAILLAFTHHQLPVNKDYLSPLDRKEADFWTKPLMMDPMGRSILMDASWCSPSFYEVFATAARKFDGGTDTKIGKAAERFLRDEFMRHGVPSVGGDYDAAGEHGECDLVVETPENLFFLELKKKPLTRSAQGGNDLKLLVDLSQSLVEAQAQAGGHEVRLRKDGVLHLERDGGAADVQLNGREVERIAVSLLDFGTLQDRTLVERFLETAIRYEFSVPDAKLNEELDDLRIHRKALIEQYTKMVELEPGRKQHPFFPCWFLSVPQILVLLDDVTNPESFKNALWATRHMTMGTLDFYFEFATRKSWMNAVP
ncbi:MAG: hypothetical protein JST38_07230 [Bacteroidetes bacterium]|nr:hypothetical protein [Bacteroidota bacterium]